MRWGQMSKVTISQLTIHRSHTHTQHCPVTRINTLCGPHVLLCTCTASPQAIPSGRVGPITPGQDPDSDKQHADTHRGMWWPHKVLILVAGPMCLCDLSCDPAMIKCAVKFTLLVQFRLKLVWMCLNGSSTPWCQIINHYVKTGIDSHRWRTCVYDRCVLTVKLIIDPTLMKCAVKLTLFFQFRWKCVWMCMNDSSLPRYQIISHM